MRPVNKKIILALSAAAIAFPIGIGMAVTTNVNATATFLAALILTPSNMQFGKIIYSADPSVAGDFVKIGTNGAELFGGVFSSSGGTVTAGDVAITGTYGYQIDVQCDATAIMSNGAGKVINITAIEVKKESTAGAFGTGTACAGIGSTVLSWNLTSGTDDQLKVGGQITGVGASSPFAGGAYSTASAGGNDIQINIVYN